MFSELDLVPKAWKGVNWTLFELFNLRGVQVPNNPIDAKVFMEDLNNGIAKHQQLPLNLVKDIVAVIFFHKN